MLRSCRLMGVSRGTSGRRSLSITSAARSTRLRDSPCATGQRLHRAGHDRHPGAFVTAARDRRAEIAIAVERQRAFRDFGSVLRREKRDQLFDGRLLAELVAQEPAAVIRNDELHVNASRKERGQRPRRINGAAGSGDRDGDS